jgi:SagB-type dehydrogenase family enzyme
MDARRRDNLRRRAGARTSTNRILRASQTVILGWEKSELVACNFITRRVMACSADLAEFLSSLQDWRSEDDVISSYFGVTIDMLDALVDATFLVARGSDEARREDEYAETWNWGTPAAMLHFCLQDAEFLSLEATEQLQIEKSRETKSPSLHLTNTGRYETVVPLGPSPKRENALTELMASRRTIRECDPDALIGKDIVSKCLFAGLGITGWTRNSIGELPLGMTPSGGARNPFEAYLFANRIKGLAPGIYHYSALEHSLGLVSEDDTNLPDLVAGQEWAGSMTCAIVLCASLDRTMWKYADPNAYRVVMIEAGHIGQNIMLAATEHGLTACPTAALSHSRIRELIGLEKMTDSPIYALTLGVPSAGDQVAA